MSKLHISALGELLARYGRAFRLSWQHRAEFESIPRRRDEAEFLPAVLALQDTPINPLPRMAMWAIVTLLLVSLLWACFGKIDIVAVATGKVVLNGNSKTIQAPDSARISQIHVTDGQVVKAGDVLLTLDGEAAAADVSRLQQSLSSARLDVAQGQALEQAISSGATPQLTQTAQNDPTMAAEAQRRVSSLYIEYQTKYSQLGSQLVQHEAERQSVQAQITSMQQSLPLIQQQENDYQTLLAQNYIPRHAFLEKQRQRVELAGNLAIQKSRLNELNASIQATRDQQLALNAETRRTGRDTIQQGMLQSAQIQQDLVKATRQSRMMSITAPVSGTVQQLAVHTVGGMVTPAQALMVIVPKQDGIEVDVTVENKDIGFVNIGQEAVVKVETFQFTKYGTLPAHVVSISQDAIDDEKRGPIFNAQIALDRSWLDVDGKRVTLSPGMAVTAEIKTGKRRIIEYFLSPLLQHSKESLGER
jgi:hemolysin D